MNAKSYYLISGVIFALVAMMHLCRLLVGWQITLGSWEAPMWVSVAGLLVAGFLSLWAFRLAMGKTLDVRRET